MPITYGDPRWLNMSTCAVGWAPMSTLNSFYPADDTELLPARYWRCSYCGSLQKKDRVKCANCGGERENLSE